VVVNIHGAKSCKTVGTWVVAEPVWWGYTKAWSVACNVGFLMFLIFIFIIHV
jgi:hypothetical protein